MKIIKSLVWVFFGFSVIASAQSNSFYIIASNPQGEWKDAFKSDMGFGVGIGGFIKGDRGRWKLDYTAYSSSENNFSTKLSNTVIMWDIHNNKPNDPYLLLGIGWCFSKIEVSYGNMSDSVSDNSLVLDLGGGYQFKNGYVELFYRDLKFDGGGDFGKLKAPSINIALGFNF